VNDKTKHTDMNTQVSSLNNEHVLSAEEQSMQALVEQVESAHPSRSHISRGLWAFAGFFFFALGSIGVVLPILPTTPFILVAAFCFARSSERLNNWFKGTRVYKTVFEHFVEKRTMTVKAKLSILIPVTLLMGIAAYFMRNATIPLIILGIVWVAHIIYFGFVVPTEPAEGPSSSSAQDTSNGVAQVQPTESVPTEPGD